MNVYFHLKLVTILDGMRLRICSASERRFFLSNPEFDCSAGLIVILLLSVFDERQCGQSAQWPKDKSLEQLCIFYENIAQRPKFATVQHFIEEGYKRSGLYNIIDRYLKNGTTEFKAKSGRPVSLSTPENVRKVKRYLNNKRNCLSFAAKRIGVSKKNVQDMKKRIGLKTRKCITVPKYTQKQEKRAKTNCRKVYRKSIGKILILDDETYVKREPKANYGKQFYHTLNNANVPKEVKFNPKAKFGSNFQYGRQSMSLDTALNLMLKLEL